MRQNLLINQVAGSVSLSKQTNKKKTERNKFKITLNGIRLCISIKISQPIYRERFMLPSLKESTLPTSTLRTTITQDITMELAYIKLKMKNYQVEMTKKKKNIHSNLKIFWPLRTVSSSAVWIVARS